jgi:hypothetical protein
MKHIFKHKVCKSKATENLFIIFVYYCQRGPHRFLSRALMHLEVRQAPPYKSLDQALKSRLDSGLQNHEHEANIQRGT